MTLSAPGQKGVDLVLLHVFDGQRLDKGLIGQIKFKRANKNHSSEQVLHFPRYNRLGETGSIQICISKYSVLQKSYAKKLSL